MANYLRNWEYSKNEQKIIEHFGYSHLMTVIDPLGMIRLMVEKAFLDNDQTVYAEALRRGVKVLGYGKIYRETPEWEYLLKTE
jgi:hypothetical protein